MTDRQRRQPAELVSPVGLRAGLTRHQLDALTTLEQFGWTLKFVRRPLFQDPVAVLFRADSKKFVVLRTDGSIDEHPDFKLRD
ncbi:MULTISPECIES: hypothetical protein [Lysobacter]|uniref:hypothetical protein n=1 Tax=Lysobacter TaxID=68 RepID=UPI001F30DBDA|nr:MULTISPECIES: hypothetical protein [Lysobacter]UJB19791.1 hypothetical protein L1A79_01445 [Lysobacter capsici]UJQ26483.1 hypothetical protein L2D09_13415 [Lysobacter gummosus]